METSVQITFGERYPLGKRAFFLFLLRRIKFPSAILVLTLLFWYFSGFIPVEYSNFNGYTLKAGFALFVLLLLAKISRTYFEYRGYSFMFEKEYFRITRGYFAKNDISIAYHQIQHVNVRSSFLDQLLGICHVTLVMASNDGGRDSMLLPAVSRARGLLVQREIMLQARRHFYRPQENQTVDTPD